VIEGACCHLVKTGKPSHLVWSGTNQRVREVRAIALTSLSNGVRNQ